MTINSWIPSKCFKGAWGQAKIHRAEITMVVALGAIISTKGNILCFADFEKLHRYKQKYVFFVYLDVLSCKCTCKWIYIYIYTYVYMYIHMYIHYTYIHMYVLHYTYIHMCIYIITVYEIHWNNINWHCWSNMNLPRFSAESMPWIFRRGRCEAPPEHGGVGLAQGKTAWIHWWTHLATVRFLLLPWNSYIVRYKYNGI